MIEDYFEFLKNVTNKNPSVKQFRLVREFIGVNRGRQPAPKTRPKNENVKEIGVLSQFYLSITKKEFS